MVLMPWPLRYVPRWKGVKILIVWIFWLLYFFVLLDLNSHFQFHTFYWNGWRTDSKLRYVSFLFVQKPSLRNNFRRFWGCWNKFLVKLNLLWAMSQRSHSIACDRMRSRAIACDCMKSQTLCRQLSEFLKMHREQEVGKKVCQSVSSRQLWTDFIYFFFAFLKKEEMSSGTHFTQQNVPVLFNVVVTKHVWPYFQSRFPKTSSERVSSS